MNAVLVRGHASGDIFLSGRGAGMMPTASSVVADIIETARSHQIVASNLRPPLLGWKKMRDDNVRAMDEASLSYYLRLSVSDLPGVLSSISGVFGRHNISIAQVIQRGRTGADSVDLVMLTHKSSERDLQAAVEEAKKMDVVSSVRLIRIEGSL